mgnify:CR=1 FL=1
MPVEALSHFSGSTRIALSLKELFLLPLEGELLLGGGRGCLPSRSCCGSYATAVVHLVFKHALKVTLQGSSIEGHDRDKPSGGSNFNH